MMPLPESMTPIWSSFSELAKLARSVRPQRELDGGSSADCSPPAAGGPITVHSKTVADATSSGAEPFASLAGFNGIERARTTLAKFTKRARVGACRDDARGVENIGDQLDLEQGRSAESFEPALRVAGSTSPSQSICDQPRSS